MNYAKILGTGSCLPKTVLTNSDLEKLSQTSDEWIRRRVGIESRHVIGDSDETNVSLSLTAANNALEAAGLTPDDIGLIIVGTATGEFFFPSTACLIQKGLGITTACPAFDVNAACSGFIYALSIADQYIKTGAVKHALVIGVDSLTKMVDWTDRTTSVLFGDGAGAVVLGSDPEHGILKTILHADGHFDDCLYSKNPIWYRDEEITLNMRGSEVFKIAVTKLGEIVDEILEQTGTEKSEIDWLVPHQANKRIIAATAKKLNMSMDRVVVTVETHGNTSAASIPLALDVAVREGKIQRGQKILLEAFGAGLAWGAALLTY